MSFHWDSVVDAAMRANIGGGYHFWDPDTARGFKSKPVRGFMSADGSTAYVVERYRTVRFASGTVVQVPHSRVIVVDMATGRADGGEVHYRTNAQAIKAARAMAEGGAQ
jgi:hypothetical protein